MQFKYKIIEVYPEQHSIVVRFYSDAVTEQDLAVQVAEDGTVLRGRTDYSFDLPVPAPTGAALDEFICARAPAQWLENMAAVKDPAVDTSLGHVQELVGVEKVGADVTVVPVADPAAVLAQEANRVAEIKALIQQVLSDMVADKV